MVRWISEGVYSVGLLGAKAEIPDQKTEAFLRAHGTTSSDPNSWIADPRQDDAGVFIDYRNFD